MKYCRECGKEMHDYTDMCQNCGSLLFQDCKITRQQKEKQKSKNKLFSTIDIVFIYFTLFLISTLLGRFINNIPGNISIIYIFLIIISIGSCFIYFILYFITHKSNQYVFYLMLAMNIILMGIDNYFGNNFHIIFHTVLHSVILIALYIELRNSFEKDDLIDFFLYMLLGTTLWGLIRNTKPIFFSNTNNYDIYFIWYFIISIMMCILFIILIIKYLNRKKNTNINVYIILFNTIILVNMTMLSFLRYLNLLTNIKIFINDFVAFTIQSIIINAALFFTINKTGDYNNIFKTGILLITFNIFKIALFNYEILYENVIVIRSFIISGILPIIINIVSHFITRNIKVKCIEGNNVA